MRRLTVPAIVVATTVLIALSVLGLVLSMTGPRTHDLDPISKVIYLSNPLFIGALGGAIMIRRPRHWAGWTMQTIAVALVVDSLSKGVLSHYTANQHWADRMASLATWLDNWTWTIVFLGMLYTLLKFADGPRRRWLLRIGWVGMASMAVTLVLCVLASGSVSDYKKAAPLFVIGLTDTAVNKFFGLFFGLWIAGFVAATVALISKYRRAVGGERAQLRWLLWSFGSVIGLSIASPVVDFIVKHLQVHGTLVVTAANVLQEASVLTIPLAIFISVTRYGLFEIDRVVSRTVSYSLVTVTLTLSYVVIATSASRLVPDRFGSLPVVAATLAVAALFVPVHRRMTSFIDRRFNRSRYDAEHVVATFAERVRRDGAEDPNGRDLLVAVAAVLQPAHASVWLVPTGSR